LQRVEIGADAWFLVGHGVLFRPWCATCRPLAATSAASPAVP
jgi:hypothetical protein